MKNNTQRVDFLYMHVRTEIFNTTVPGLQLIKQKNSSIFTLRPHPWVNLMRVWRVWSDEQQHSLVVVEDFESWFLV